MYDKNIASEELKVFHQKVKVTAFITELVENTHYITENLFIDNYSNHKLIPLFYFDEVTGDDNIRIVGNNTILYTDYNDLNGIYFSSNKKDITINVYHEIVELKYYDNPETDTPVLLRSQKFLRLHFYDATSFYTFNNFQFHLFNETMGIDKDYTADKYGNIVLKLDNPVGEFIITGNGQELSFEIEEE